MQIVRGFKGFRYNPKVIKDFGEVIIPPYDIISPEFREYLAGLNEYNFVHIDLPKEGKDGVSKYESAGKIYSKWKRDGVLLRDSSPKAYWLYQYFRDFSGMEYTRLALLALVKLPVYDADEPKIFPHEKTFDKPIEDRSLLFRATNSELSPVFLLFSDTDNSLRGIFDTEILPYSNENEIVEFTTFDGVVNRYFVSDWKNELTELFEGKVFYIADGHHRFKMALGNLRKRMELNGGSSIGVDDPYLYVFSALVCLEDPGLVIYSPHRVVRNLPSGMSVGSFMDVVKEFFEVESCEGVGLESLLGRLLFEDGVNTHCYGVLTRDGGVYLIRLKEDVFNSLIKDELSKVVPRVCVYPLHRFIFDTIEERYGTKVELEYEPDVSKCVEYLRNNKAELVFFLGKISPGIVKECAEVGEFMPQKSTYFFPKIPSGLVIYELTEESL